MSTGYDELDRHEAAKRAASAKPTLCLVCGNKELPRVLTPGCLSCKGLAEEWDFGREAMGVGWGQAQAELHAVLAEASGQRAKPGPLPVEARILREPHQLNKFDPRDWGEIREHWRRARLAGLNRVPVSGCALALIGVGLLLAALLPKAWNWIGLTIVLVGLTFWLAPWWWLE